MKKLRVIAMTAVLLMSSVSGGVCSYAAEAETETQSEAASEAAKEGVASADEMAPAEELDIEGLTPVLGEDVEDGVYTVEVDSSSSMFKIVDCQLTVKEGEMTAVMTMSGTGYSKVFMGTGEEAVEASEEDFIPSVENEDGLNTFEVPVEALDQAIDCAAFSKRKEKWYDRQLVFKASSLPQEVLKNIQMTTLESLNLEDGSYLVEVSLEGGSGKTKVESPTELTVENGTATAVITWGSPHYDYMLVGGEKFEPVNTEGNSSFEIPVTGFDYKMSVIADTVAMSTPHEIDYTLYFDSSSIEKAE